MANDNVIDELSLQIDANANAAIRNLSKMQSQLRNLARDVGRVGAASRSLSGFANSVKSIGQTNVANLKGTVTQLKRLSEIDYKKLDGKSINITVKVTGADKMERLELAMKDAERVLDSSKISEKLKKAFQLDDDVTAKVRKQIDGAFKSLSNKDEKGYKIGFNSITDTLFESGSVALSEFDNYTSMIKKEYMDLVQYFKSNPLLIPKDVTNKSKFFEDLGLSDYQRRSFFSNQGVGIDERDRKKLANMAPNLMASFDYGADDKTQIDNLFRRLADARELMSKRINLRDAFGIDGGTDALGVMQQKVKEISDSTLASFENAKNKSMSQSANKIPLDVSVDPVRIRHHIEDALAEATKNEFELPLKFDFSKLRLDLKSTIVDSVQGIDAGTLGTLSENVQGIARSMTDLATSNPSESGVTSLVNAIKRLSDVDTSKFSAETFSALTDGVSKIAGLKDISSGVSRLVSALARLASAGDKTQTTANSLPKLGEAIKSVMGGLSSMGGLPAELNAFVGSIAQLASAGNKTSATASQLAELGTAVKNFITTLSGAPEVSENILQMANSLAQLASAGGKAGTSARSINNAVNKVGKGSSSVVSRINALKNIVNDLGNVFRRVGSWIGSSASKIVSSLSNIKGAGISLNGATQSIKNMIGAMIGFRGITGLVNVGKQVLTLGGNLTEIDHIVESVFGDMAQYVDTWSKTAIEKFGIASQSAKQYSGTLSAMFQASGLAQKDAGIMGVRLTELAGDLSAFYNIDTETAFKKIQSGMAGMVRPLRDLGIDLTAATLSEYALSQGIQKSYTDMTQAEKVMLRYNYLIHATELQSGDFERTNKSLANSLRTLKAYLSEIGTQIGVGLASAIRHVVVWLNTMMQYLVKGATAFATFMQTIFGKYKGGASGMAFDASSMVDDTSELEDAANGTASGLEDADEAAKKLKKDLSVLPFDELNQLNKDRESTSSSKDSGGGGGAGALGDLGKDLLDWSDLMNNSEAGKLPDAISEWAERCKAAFKKGDWDLLGKELASGINEGIQKVYDALDFNKFKKKVDPFITGFTQTFNSLVRNVDWKLLGKTVGQGINNIVYAVNRLLTEIDWTQIGKSFADFANGLVNKVNFAEIGKMFGNKFMVLWKTLYGFAQDFDWKEFGKKLGAGINGLNSAISWTTVAKAMATSLNGLFTSLSNFAKTVNWGDIAKNITNGINTFIKNFKWKDNGKALGDFIGNLCDTLISIIEKTNWDEFGKGLAQMLQQIPWGKILEVVGKAIVSALGGILKGLASTPAGSFATALINALIAFKIGTALFPFANAIVTAIAGKGVGALLAGKVGELMTTFQGSITAAIPAIGSAISSGFSTIVSSIGSAVTAIGGALAAITPTGWIVIGVIAGVAALTAFVITHWDEVKKAAEKLKDGLAKAWDKIKESAKKLKDGIASAWNNIKDTTKNVFEKTKEHIDTIWGNINFDATAVAIKDKVVRAWNTVRDTTKSVFDAVKNKAESVWDAVGNKVSSIVTSAKSNVSSAWSNIKNNTAEVFSNVKEHVTSALKNVSAKVKEVAPSAYQTIHTNWNNIKTATTTAFDAVNQKASRVWGDVKSTVSSAIESISKKMTSTFKSATDKFESALESISNKASKKFGNIKDAVDGALESLKSTFGKAWSLSISNSRPHIPVPHFEKSGSFSLNPPSIPTYRFAGWWKKGGLFKGGDGQVIGVAESGRDEAVLPLENNKAMATIGAAIANASNGNLGISKDDIVDAVVTAMAMNPQTQEVIVNAVLKMENDEVLARHVERGRRRIDNRYNPVAQY